MALPTHRRPGGTLYRYLAREMVFPSLFALGGLTAVVLTKDLLGFSDLVINRGLGFDVVAKIAFFQTVPLAARVLPFAVMVGSLVALGRLGADREILVLEASGLPAHRLIGPVLAFAAAAAAVGFALSLLFAPLASRALDASLSAIAQQHPGAVLRAGTVSGFGSWKIEAREVSPDGVRMKSVAVWVPQLGETVFALNGSLDPTASDAIAMVLEDGVALIDPRRELRELSFSSLRAELPRGDQPIERGTRERLSGAHVGELRALWRSEAAEGSLARDARLELHRRFSLPLASLIFGLLILPLFLGRAHFSRSGGGMLGVAATLVYYGLVQLGNGLIQADVLGVVAGVWLPNAALGVVALLLVARLPRVSSFGRHTGRAQPRDSGPRSRRSRSPAPERDSARRIRVRRFALPRYVAGRFGQMLLLCFGIILVAYLLVDVLERLQWFARYGATATEVLRFYAARIPLLASRVIPMALLVATSLTVALLGVQGELTGIRACGIPGPRALLPILAICALVAPASFLLNNEIVPRTNALADYLKSTEIKGRANRSSAGASPSGEQDREARPVWYRAGTRFTEAERLDSRLGTARDITFYELSPAGLPTSRVDARGARHIGSGVWRLIDAVRVERSANGPRRVPAERFVDLGESVSAEVDTMHLSVGELRREIREIKAGGLDATVYEVDLFVKIATPLACLVLPALALFFGVTGPPFPSSAASLVLSAAVAVAYVLLTGVGASLGYGGALPPAVAGWSPTLVFGAVALYFGLRLRGFGQTFLRRQEDAGGSK